jgi:hypothetical protein
MPFGCLRPRTSVPLDGSEAAAAGLLEILTYVPVAAWGRSYTDLTRKGGTRVSS